MKNKPIALMSDDELQRTVLAGEVNPGNAWVSAVHAMARIANQYDLAPVLAELGKPVAVSQNADWNGAN